MYYEAYPENILPGFDEGLLGNTLGTDVSKGIDIQVDAALWDRHTLTVGVSHQRQSTVPGSLGNYDPVTFGPRPGGYGPITPTIDSSSRTINALYAQDVIRINDDIEATLGIRHDDYSNSGGTTNPRAALVWSINPKATLKLLHGRAFKAPTASELYSKVNPAISGDPNLNPSIVTTSEVSLNYQFRPTLGVQTSLFHSKLEDAIIVVDQVYANAGNQDFQGAEFELNFGDKRQSHGYANLTVINSKDADSGKELANTPKQIANLGFNARLSSQVNWNINVHYNGKMKRDEEDPRDDISAYGITDTTLLFTNKQNNKSLRLAVKNIMDKEFVDPDPSGDDAFPANGLYYDYPHAGRSVYVEGRMSF
jgi:iron complex outermembrane receptor protein